MENSVRLPQKAAFMWATFQNDRVIQSFISVEFQSHPFIATKISLFMVCEQIDSKEVEDLAAKYRKAVDNSNKATIEVKHLVESLNNLKRKHDALHTEFRPVGDQFFSWLPHIGFLGLKLVELDRKHLEQVSGFLKYVTQTCSGMIPYIIRFHLTIDGWRENRTKEGWQRRDYRKPIAGDSNVVTEEMLAMKAALDQPSKSLGLGSSGI